MFAAFLLFCASAAPPALHVAHDGAAPSALIDQVRRARHSGTTDTTWIRAGQLGDGSWALYDGFTDALWLAGPLGDLTALGLGHPLPVDGGWIVRTEAGLATVDPAARALAPLGAPGESYAALAPQADGLLGVRLRAGSDGLRAQGVILTHHTVTTTGPEVALGAWRLCEDGFASPAGEVLLCGAPRTSPDAAVAPVDLAVLTPRSGEITPIGPGTAELDLTMNAPAWQARATWGGDTEGRCVNRVDPATRAVQARGCDGR